MRPKYALLRAKSLELLGGCCAHCGGVEPSAEQRQRYSHKQAWLEFDHIDPATKVMTISAAIRSTWTWEQLLVELEKCQILCRPCHLAKTREDGSNITPVRYPELEHGTGVGYVRDRCRCELCREWSRLYKLKVVDSRGRPTGKPAPPIRRFPRPSPTDTKPVAVTCGACGDSFDLLPKVYRRRMKTNMSGELGCSKSCGNVIANRIRKVPG